MKRVDVRDPRIWLATLSLLAVIALVLVDLERTSPGPIGRTHAQVAELAAQSKCEACHGGMFQEMADACAVCHAEIGEDLATNTGFHGTLAGVDATSCSLCHLEHLGEERRLVDERSFALAGFATREAFDHASIEFELEGSHAELGCADCHADADAELLVVGQKRFLGLDRACVACHEDVHAGRIVRECAACHGQEHPFAEVAVFEHDGFVQDGAHAEVGCQECHAQETLHAVENLAGAGPFPKERDCAACHETPHAPALLDAVGLLAGTTAGASCAACHTAVHGDFAGHEDAVTAELHAASGFPLDAPHDAIGCDECHPRSQPGGGAPLGFAERFPGREADACAACHDDPHGGQFAQGVFAGAGCLACHERHAFDPPDFDIQRHAQTDFPLVGSHEAVACTSCHLAESEDAPRTFRGTPAECEACHTDAHRGLFAAIDDVAAADRAQGCALCHLPTRFDEFREDVFDHGRWTSFRLDGAHARADCASCHASSETPDDAGRRFGFVHELFGDATDDCATCHGDPHDGAFSGDALARVGAPRRVEGRAGCERCHVSESFREPALASFDHGQWTGFPLDGAHAKAGCTSCHARSPQPDALGRTFGRVHELFGDPADDCQTCHADVHEGAFDSAGLPQQVADRAGCARCHTSASFRMLTDEPFDEPGWHERWTGYPLAELHGALSCDSCHTRAPGGDTERRLGRVRGSACSDCHADPHVGQFADRGEVGCASCHLDDGGLTFDHDRDSRFALDEQHDDLACSACHVAWPLPDGSSAVRYKPLGTTCAQCHGPVDQGGGGAPRSSGSGGR